ncbi:hypothetical protein NMQ03_13860 [Arthrobacter sp. DNA4]|uniref:DUF7847 domain-containing protein n=1 Tax=Arthrobacter sp. DNA4 TaxID=2963432 RepID=UPI0020CF60E0|nr:hypothetical protein [Arthrobacter sp. DNA4]UTT68334.1 hypothetical protein NMQ03_13860 [Arthrobacter sp. DNA4]
MSAQGPERGEPTPAWPGNRHDDGGSAAPEDPARHLPGSSRGRRAWQSDTGKQPGPGQQSAAEQQWAPVHPAQQAPGWEERRPWQQQSPQQPPQWQQRGQYPYSDAPHSGPPYPGAPYGASPYGQPRYVAPPKPGIIPLRPLMFGEILDGSFQGIRRNAKAMLGAGILAQSLSAILAAVLTGVVATSSGSIESWATTASSADVASLGIGLMVTFAFLSILSVFMSVVLQGAMVVPVARSVLNRPTGFRRMLSLVRPRIGALIRLAAVLMAAAVAAIALFFAVIVLLFSNVRGAAALLVIPLMMGFAVLFLWVAIKLMVAPAAVVIEELGALAGLRRSWTLTRANWWRILGITLVVGILVAVITQVVLIPASILPTVLSGVVSPHGGSGQDATLTVTISIITAVVGALVGAVGYAFQTSVMALLYMDLRMRKDGLDIVLLRDLETGADPDGIPGRNAGTGSTPYPGYGTAPGAWPYGR